MNSLAVVYKEVEKDEDASNDVDEEIDASSWLATRLSSEQTDAKKTKSNLKNKRHQTS